MSDLENTLKFKKISPKGIKFPHPNATFIAAYNHQIITITDSVNILNSTTLKIQKQFGLRQKIVSADILNNILLIVTEKEELAVFDIKTYNRKVFEIEGIADVKVGKNKFVVLRNNEAAVYENKTCKFVKSYPDVERIFRDTIVKKDSIIDIETGEEYKNFKFCLRNEHLILFDGTRIKAEKGILNHKFEKEPLFKVFREFFVVAEKNNSQFILIANDEFELNDDGDNLRFESDDENLEPIPILYLFGTDKQVCMVDKHGNFSDYLVEGSKFYEHEDLEIEKFKDIKEATIKDIFYEKEDKTSDLISEYGESVKKYDEKVEKYNSGFMNADEKSDAHKKGSFKIDNKNETKNLFKINEATDFKIDEKLKSDSDEVVKNINKLSDGDKIRAKPNIFEKETNLSFFTENNFAEESLFSAPVSKPPFDFKNLSSALTNNSQISQQNIEKLKKLEVEESKDEFSEVRNKIKNINVVFKTTPQLHYLKNPAFFEENQEIYSKIRHLSEICEDIKRKNFVKKIDSCLDLVSEKCNEVKFENTNFIKSTIAYIDTKIVKDCNFSEPIRYENPIIPNINLPKKVYGSKKVAFKEIVEKCVVDVEKSVMVVPERNVNVVDLGDEKLSEKFNVNVNGVNKFPPVNQLNTGFGSFGQTGNFNQAGNFDQAVNLNQNVNLGQVGNFNQFGNFDQSGNMGQAGNVQTPLNNNVGTKTGSLMDQFKKKTGGFLGN